MPVNPADTASNGTANPDCHRTGPIFLVVDDDAMVRKIVAKGLAALNPAEVLEVEDGLAAQALLVKTPIDVVVTDVLMPNMTGLELMKWAQQHCPEPLWIVLSGLETFDAAVDALQLGAFDFLGKPPEVQRVRVAVRNALDQIELVRERRRLYQQIERSNAQLAEKVLQLEQVCHMLEEQAAVIQSDLDRAEVIQHALLPQEPPELDGWCLETLYRSGSSVGGDLYDVITLDQHHLGLVIADAAGHGVAAAMMSVLFKLRLNLIDRDGGLKTPGEVLGSLNRKLGKNLSAPGAFITAAYVLLDQRSGRAQFASAGHPPCIWTSPAGESRQLTRTGPALGLDAAADYQQSEFQLAAGDRLLLYTDGVLGSGSGAACPDDLARTLCSSIDRIDLPGTLYRAATQEAAGERDDITMILLERCQGVSHFNDIAAGGERQPPQSPASTEVRLLQGVSGQQAFLSIGGTMSWVSSQGLLDTAIALQRQCAELIIDLAECEYMDSTCLGTLHEIVSLRPQAVFLQRMPAAIRELFEELSMAVVLRGERTGFTPLPEAMAPLQQRAVDAAEQGKRMLSAHETLASLSPENREKFRGVVDSLRAELGHRE